MGGKALWKLRISLETWARMVFIFHLICAGGEPTRTFFVCVFQSLMSACCPVLPFSQIRNEFPRCPSHPLLPPNINTSWSCASSNGELVQVYVSICSLIKYLLSTYHVQVRSLYKLVLVGRSVCFLRGEVRYRNYYNRREILPHCSKRTRRVFVCVYAYVRSLKNRNIQVQI